MSRHVRGMAAIALLGLVAGCSSLTSLSGRSDGLSKPERVDHVLSRLTFGARTGDADRVAAMGVDQWIEQQLRPETIPDGVLAAALAPIPEWSTPTTEFGSLESVQKYARIPMAMLMKDTAALMALKLAGSRFVAGQFYAGKVIRAQTSERQLLEIMSDLWENHFSVYNGKVPSPESLILFDRDVLRAHALGKFRDLLSGVAHSPAMLFYLDNHLSKRGAPNENYARELLELHTLGVDGGYTQHDVIEVARALTGWTITTPGLGARFVFRTEMHDTGSKTVLGHALRSGRGIQDGEDVLDIIARHPSTAHHIAFVIARRLVSDEPPASVVDRAAATFTRTDGDIAAVVRTIITSREFFSRAAFRAKVKSPFELVVSSRRAIDAPADTTSQTEQLIGRLGQPTFGFAAPNGWPEKGAEWMNAGTIYQRLRFAGDFVGGRVAQSPIEQWHDWSTLSAQPLQGQVDGVVKSILGGFAAPATREAMLAVDPTVTDGAQRLRAVLTVAFSSPEFQRR